MNAPNGNGFWWKIAGMFAPFVIAGFIALVSMGANLKNLQAQVDQKASRDVVQAQLADISNQLRDIRAQLDRIERRTQ